VFFKIMTFRTFRDSPAFPAVLFAAGAAVGAVLARRKRVRVTETRAGVWVDDGSVRKLHPFPDPSQETRDLWAEIAELKRLIGTDEKVLVQFTRSGVRVGGKRGNTYKFPEPKYLVHLINLIRKRLKSNDTVDPLLKCLLAKRGDMAKEISETFSAIEAVRKAVDAAPGVPSYNELLKSGTPVNVYVPGDGKKPYTAAALSLMTPSTWTIVAVDPLMSEKFSTERVHCVCARAEDLCIPSHDENQGAISIIISVHAHCDLDEFAASIPGTRIVVSLPCCGTCGLVRKTPDIEYEDLDVLSPKRTIKAWFLS